MFLKAVPYLKMHAHEREEKYTLYIIIYYFFLSIVAEYVHSIFIMYHKSFFHTHIIRLVELQSYFFTDIFN